MFAEASPKTKNPPSKMTSQSAIGLVQTSTALFKSGPGFRKDSGKVAREWWERGGEDGSCSPVLRRSLSLCSEEVTVPVNGEPLSIPLRSLGSSRDSSHSVQEQNR